MGLGLLLNIYELKARLYPALISLVPPISILLGLNLIASNLQYGLIFLFASFGIFYLLSIIVRELGKCLEESLFKSWGGKPTTQILRHRDKTIDPLTKARYHNFLAAHLGLQFPSKAAEEDDPASADEIYQSGIKWLLDKTRDAQKFNLLFKENIAFGFCRNCLGVKPYALVINIGSIFWLLISQNVFTNKGFDWNAMVALHGGAWIALILCFFMLAVWIFFLTKKTAETAAFSYAKRLLSACDALVEKS